VVILKDFEFMKILIPAVLAAACAQPLSACDLCSVYAATEAQGGSGQGFFGGVAEQFTRFGTLQEEGRKAPNAIGQYIDSSVSQVFAGYNFNDRFGLQLNLPVIYRSYLRPRGAVIDRGSEFGIGDLSLIGNFLAYQKLQENFTLNWNLLGGLKLPTGDSSHLKEMDVASQNGLPASGIGGHDLALGSGSVDGVVGTSLSARWKRLFLNGGLQYAARTEGDFGHQYANDLTWSGGPGVYLALTHKYTLAFQALVSGETKDKDTVNGVPDGDSAETIVYLGPQISFTWQSKLSAQLGADFPMSIDNSGLQVVPDYRVHAAFTWRF
jgi:opacity protein-like surface antigen